MFTRVGRWWKNRWLKSTSGARVDWACQVIEEASRIVNLPEVANALPETAEKMAWAQKVGIGAPGINAADQLEFQILGRRIAGLDERQRPMVYPVLQRDGDVLQGLVAGFCQRPSVGMYFPGMHMIVLKMDYPETIRYMAHTFLHEVGHAIVAERENRIWTNVEVRSPAERFAEELRMQYFDFRLESLLGGEPFRRQMEADIAKTVRRFDAGGELGRMEKRDGGPLAFCYGPLPEGVSPEGRHFLYSLHCHLSALTEFLGPHNAYSFQLDWIAWYCKSADRRLET